MISRNDAAGAAGPAAVMVTINDHAGVISVVPKQRRIAAAAEPSAATALPSGERGRGRQGSSAPVRTSPCVRHARAYSQSACDERAARGQPRTVSARSPSRVAMRRCPTPVVAAVSAAPIVSGVRAAPRYPPRWQQHLGAATVPRRRSAPAPDDAAAFRSGCAPRVPASNRAALTQTQNNLGETVVLGEQVCVGGHDVGFGEFDGVFHPALGGRVGALCDRVR